MPANTDVGITNYQVRAGNQSPYTANRLATWTAATTKGVVFSNGTTTFAPSQDMLVIGAIVVFGGIWYVYRRRIAATVKKVEGDA